MAYLGDIFRVFEKNSELFSKSEKDNQCEKTVMKLAFTTTNSFVEVYLVYYFVVILKLNWTEVDCFELNTSGEIGPIKLIDSE